MNRLAKGLVLGLFVVSVAALAYADGVDVTTTGTIPVTAKVSNVLNFSWELYDLTGYTAFSWAAPNNNNSMPFGTLAQGGSGDSYSASWYSLILYTAANKPYNVQQTSVSLSDGAGHDLDDAFVVTPDYQTGDLWDGLHPQGSKDTDALGTASLVEDANILYAGNEGKGRIIRFYYAIPETSTISNFVPVPPSQAPGDYSGSVTVSIVLQ